jgi:hypothetical protein
LDFFQGLHLLHNLTLAVESIHRLREYHGDLHAENVIVRRLGLGFQVRLLDFFPWGKPRPAHLKDDICDVIRLFYDAVGGRGRYAKHPAVVKNICCGLKRSLILAKFPRISRLREHLETLEWDRTR